MGRALYDLERKILHPTPVLLSHRAHVGGNHRYFALSPQRMPANMRKQHQTTILKPWFLVKVTTQTTSRLSTINNSTITKPPSTLPMAPLRTTPTLLHRRLLSTTTSRASEAMRLLTASSVKFAAARSTLSVIKTSARGSMSCKVFSCH